MEGLIWYVLFIIEKRKGEVILKFVELRYGRHKIPLDLRKKDTAGSFMNALTQYFLAELLCVDMFSYF